MAKIAQRLTELIGRTPMLKLGRYAEHIGTKAGIIAKLEYFNPLGSVKDRVAYAMICDAEQKGLITKDTVIIEPTSGNTGVGLAFVAAAKGYKIIIVMPDSMSAERRNLVTALGAELILTPGREGVQGSIRKAEEMASLLPSAFIPQQFTNPANPRVHRETTAAEILEDTGGDISAFVAGVGTGGTISGIGQVLKEKIPGVRIIAAEPSDSAVLSGNKPGAHLLQGMGAGFIPDVLDLGVIDEICTVSSEDAFAAARAAAHTEGLLAGISSGAALHAASEISFRPEFEGRNIVVLLADSGERYLTTQLFSDK